MITSALVLTCWIALYRAAQLGGSAGDEQTDVCCCRLARNRTNSANQADENIGAPMVLMGTLSCFW